MRVAGIYEPVERELAEVEATLQSVKQVESKTIRAMLDQVIVTGGKRLRPTISLLAGQFGDYRPDLLVPLAASIELLHTATLVHDDVIDSSQTRRGRPTVNSLFPNDATVMLGDFMFAHAADLICRTGSLDVVKLFSRTLLAMAAGELSQDMTVYDYSRDTRDYFQRIAGKTASLFATSAEGGAMVAGAPPDQVAALRDYGESLGMAFQIVDDILDFAGTEEELGKPVGSDLMQGVLTLPSLLLMERSPDDNPVKRLFADQGNPDHLADAIVTIKSSDILDEAYAVARDFHGRAVAALEFLPDTPARAALLDLADHVLDRRV